jgi:hypothetical protein
MKLIIATLLLSAAAASPVCAAEAAPAALVAQVVKPGPRCVQVRDIVGTNSKDGKLMTFRMRDGSVLVNHLQGICSTLRFEGFVWNVPGDGAVCERQQSLRVLRSGQMCILGKFDLVKDKPASR